MKIEIGPFGWSFGLGGGKDSCLGNVKSDKRSFKSIDRSKLGRRTISGVIVQDKRPSDREVHTLGMTPIRTPRSAPVEVYDLLTFEEFTYLSCAILIIVSENLSLTHCPEECLVASQTIRNLLNDRAQCVRRRELANKSPSSSSSSSPAHHIKGEKQDIYNTSQSRLSSSSTLSLPPRAHTKEGCQYRSQIDQELSPPRLKLSTFRMMKSCGALALEAVFWTKSARSPTIIPLDDRNTTIGEILGVFDDGRSYLELFLPETLTWVPVDLTTVIVLHRGDCIALKTRHVEDLKDWGLYVHNLEDSFLEYIVKD
ncbi:hypothetical protein IW261DRAFT_1567206 [Armillaria novae-zelandiae]|uniref:Uncharacterized protein n=1 Tax=Armillaria novae-zelandiae TaxID=153914 RepID=A0AA39P3I5_9AGAR|nr:hypothetical protein IW261DRAFT_1567206 [Armillaria novae-zelandiae]